MDDQNQNPQTTPHNDQPSAPKQSKTIQPSESFIKEIQTEAKNSPAQPQLRPVLNTSSIYPDATGGSAAINHQLPVNDTKENTEESTPKVNTQLIEVALVIFGAFIALSAILGLVVGSRLISFGYVSSGTLFIDLIDVAYLLLGLGLIFRQELARVTYILFAVIGIVFSLYGTYRYISVIHSVAHLEQVTAPARVETYASQIALLQTDIKNLQKDTELTDAQRQQRIEDYQNQIANYKLEQQQLNKLSSASDTKMYIDLIPSYLLAIIPLYFLTRPSVKKVFN